MIHAIIRLGLVLAAPTAVVLAAPTAADASPPPTDGTETYEPGCAPIPEEQGGGELCWDETGFGPPQLLRVEPERCVVVVDPPQWVWLTAHILDDGEHRTVVFPYEYTRPGEIDFDVSPHTGTDRQVDDVWFTWNIGAGESMHTGPIDCAPDDPEPPTTTTTTTTIPTASTSTTSTPQTSTTVPPVPSAPPSPPDPPSLPRTGASSMLIWLGLGALVSGIAARTAGRDQ